MKRHWKKIAIGVAALVVVVLAASFIYAKFINKADAEFGQQDVIDKLDATTTLVTDTASTDPAATDPTGTDPTGTDAGTGGTGVEGTWNIGADSEVGYRVDETINGFATTANGRTKSITGSIEIAGSTVSTGSFTVDMTTFKSDESRRDGQFNGRIMDVANFPTSTFVLTSPIDFGAVPTDGGTVTASATGDLTLHGTTKSVTFDLEATFKNGRIGILGQIPVVFADYGIPNPSRATIATEDHGLLEFVLILDHA